MKEIKFNIRYTGGTASENKLNLYDASTSMLGFAKALSISTHTLITKGDIRQKGASAPYIKTFLHPAKKGSLIETVSILFEDPAIKSIGVSSVVAAFWAMLDYSWNIATGKEVTTDNKVVNQIIKDNDLLNDELSGVLEKPLQNIHRPISNGSGMKIEIIRPRVGKVIEFNFDTKEYVTSIKNIGINDSIIGNVTKYNIISGYGRLYIDNFSKTIPFNIDKLKISEEDEKILKWSLFKSSERDDNYSAAKLKITAEVINDKEDKIRRYTVIGADILFKDKDKDHEKVN